jgi:hypothetical protein
MTRPLPESRRQEEVVAVSPEVPLPVGSDPGPEEIARLGIPALGGTRMSDRNFGGKLVARRGEGQTAAGGERTIK